MLILKNKILGENQLLKEKNKKDLLKLQA